MARFQINSFVGQDFSSQFESSFMDILRQKGQKKVKANQGEKTHPRIASLTPRSAAMLRAVYQELIADRTHIHMNSTRWATLTGFVQYLGKTGKVQLLWIFQLCAWNQLTESFVRCRLWLRRRRRAGTCATSTETLQCSRDR
jgi:hypothetical protein